MPNLPEQGHQLESVGLLGHVRVNVLRRGVISLSYLTVLLRSQQVGPVSSLDLRNLPIVESVHK